MPRIVKIFAKKIINNGFVSIKIEVYLNTGSIGTSCMPFESNLLYNYIINRKNNDKILNILNKKISLYLNYINNIFFLKLIGKNPAFQLEIDELLLFLLKKNNNNLYFKKIILVISISIARSYSNYKKIKLYELISELIGNNKLYSIPFPIINFLDKNSNIIFNNLDIKEFMIQLNFNLSTYENIFNIYKIYRTFINKIKLLTLNYKSNILLNKSEIIFFLIKKSIDNSNLVLGKDINININLSATDLYDLNDNFYFFKEKNKILNYKEIIEYIKYISKLYSIYYIENSFHEYDWKLSFIQTKILGKKIQLVGDKIFKNNNFLFKQGINHKICNSILIKYYEISTVSEIINLIKLAKKSKYKIVISNLFRNTNDTFFIDLAIGTSSDQIKIGYINELYNYKKLI